MVSSRHLYVVRLEAKEHITNHAEIFNALRKFEVGVNLHYIPVYQQPYYSELAISKQDFVNSEIYYESAISIPLFHGMTQQDQKTVIDALKSRFSVNVILGAAQLGMNYGVANSKGSFLIAVCKTFWTLHIGLVSLK